MEQQYALVFNGEIQSNKNGEPVITGYLPEPPAGCADYHPPESIWFPVETRDEKPFTPNRLTCRGEPYFKVDKDRVLRIYPIILTRGGG